MPIDYTTTELISKVKRALTVPTSQQTFLPNDFIAFLTDEMHETLVPRIKAANEEFLVITKDVAIVSGTATYRIPFRAVGAALRDVVLVDSNGKEYELPNLSQSYEKSNPVDSADRFYGFMIRNNSVILKPTPTDAAMSLRFKYERRPNNLIAEASAATITAVNTVARTITLSNQPSDWTGATLFDFLKPEPLFESLEDDVDITTVAANVITFPVGGMPSGLAIGQWVCEAEFSPIPQLPYEAHFVLVQLAAKKILMSMDHPRALEYVSANADKALDQFTRTITPRVKGSPRKIVNRSGIFDYGRLGLRGGL